MKLTKFLNSFSILLKHPVNVLVLLMAVSIGAHILYYYLGQEAWQGPVFGPYHGAASNLFTSKGKEIWSPGSTMNNSLARRQPMYTFFLAASYFIFGETWFGVAVSLSIVCGLAGFVAYLISKKMFTYNIGILAGFWTIFYPYYFIQGSPPNIYETMLFTTLLLAAVYYLFWMQDNTAFKYTLFSALFLTLAALSRPKIVFVIPFLLIWYYLTSKHSMENRIKHAIGLTLLFFTFLAPWTMRNKLTEGVSSPFGSYGGKNFYKAYHPMMLEYYQGTGPFTDITLRSKSSDRVYEQGPLWDEQQTQGMSSEQVQTWEKSMPWSYWLNHPIQFFKLTTLKVIALWSWILEPVSLSRLKQLVYFVSYVPVLILGLVGFWLFREKWAETSLFATLFVSFTLYAAITYGVTRYRAPVDVYLIIMASATSIYISGKILEKLSWRK